DRADRIRLLRARSLEGAPPVADPRGAIRLGELHGDPSGNHLRGPDPGHRLELGEGIVGGRVDVELKPARPVPRPVSLLLRVLHASLLDRARTSARADLGGLRALRGCPDSRELLCDPTRERLHPPNRVHAGRAADDRRDVCRVLHRMGRDHTPRVRHVPDRARREAHRPEPPRAARDVGAMSSGEKYVAAAYGVFLVFVLVWAAIIAAKLSRLERETGELARLARARTSADQGDG